VDPDVADLLGGVPEALLVDVRISPGAAPGRDRIGLEVEPEDLEAL
jgi:hypothetical protein